MRALSLQNPGIGGTNSLPAPGEAGPRKGVCDKGAHVARPAPSSYHPFDAFREEEAVIECAHGVIRKDLTLLLEQKVPSVQAIICPEDGEPPFFISMNEGPKEQKNETLSLTGRTTEKDAPGVACMAPAILQHTPLFPLTPGRVDACSGKSGKEKENAIY